MSGRAGQGRVRAARADQRDHPSSISAATRPALRSGAQHLRQKARRCGRVLGASAGTIRSGGVAHGGHVRLHDISIASHLLRRVVRSKRSHPTPWSSSNHRCGAVKGRRGSNLPVQWREREGPESAAKLSLPDALVKFRSQSDLPTLAIVHRKPGVRCIHDIGTRKAPRANVRRRLRDQWFQPCPLRILRSLGQPSPAAAKSDGAPPCTSLFITATSPIATNHVIQRRVTRFWVRF